jgi:general L-amino acid transport system permease protein|tara:strand:- start:476 stop:1723 length:1248 start_codon:yes stop_codon:yes gene_type:complete
MISKNFTTNLYLGSFLILVSLIDVTLNSFFKLNFTNFLPGSISFFLPLILGTIGLYLIRSDYTGLKQLDILNKNVNTSNFNAVLTLLIIFLIIKAIPPSMSWMILDANISGDSREACTGTGACWTYIKVWFKRFMYGMYPNELHWRINAAFILVIVLGMAGLLATEKLKKYLALYYVIIYPIIAFLIIYYLISGGAFGLEWVETGAWGGLSLTFIVSFFCLIFCFPLGMIFALGRRSSLPTVRYISIGYIEFWRGVPLITVLFMSSVMFPMFLPEDFFMDKLVRVIIAITLFEAAYCAEVIRGGLQALPRGQYDAAKSLGMGYWKMHIFVILPQALKLVIPGIANTFLALVKDTPLIFVVGLAEIAGMLALAKTNPEWLGFAMEGYIFASIIFWIICYAMSKYSYNLEAKYKTER